MRATTGLCYHVDTSGKKIYDARGIVVKALLVLIYPALGFLDLDVFHKGYARAKDNNGWFHIDTSGRDISNGSLFSLCLIPLYRSLSLPQLLNDTI